MPRRSSSSGGIGVIGALGVLFVGLKLGGVIDWSWWWVTAPFWAFPAFFLSVAALCAFGVLLCWTADACLNWGMKSR